MVSVAEWRERFAARRAAEAAERERLRRLRARGKERRQARRRRVAESMRVRMVMSSSFLLLRYIQYSRNLRARQWVSRRLLVR